MNKKQLLSSIIVFCALLAVSLMVLKKEDSNWKKGKFADKTPLIKEFDVNKVAKFAITDGQEIVELAIKDNKWVVLDRNSYPADFAKIQNFIMKIRDLKIAQKLRMKKSAYGSVKLLPPEKGQGSEETGTLLSFYDKENRELLAVLLGVPHFEKNDDPQPFTQPKEDGRYLIVSGTDKPVLTIDPLSEASTDPALWLDKGFLQIPPFKTMTILDKAGKQMWRIIRKAPNAPYSLEGLKKNQKLLPRKMYEATSAFARMMFLDVLPENTDEKITGLSKPVTIIFDTFAGLTYKIKIALKKKKAFAEIAIFTDLQEKRVSGKDEKHEDKEKLDKEFAEKQKVIKKKLNQEKFFTKWIYELPLQDVKKVLIKHEDMVREQ